MGRKKIGLIREGKFPPDSRVAFTPAQCVALLQKFPELELVVQPSHGRCFKDRDYELAGITLQEDLHDCDILFGIKEVPVESLIENKTYIFFSHTIKKQPANKKLLQALLKKNITMIDYETLTDDQGNRVLAFGRWAGIVGAHNAIWTWSQRTEDFSFIRAKDCHDFNELKQYYEQVVLPPLRIVITGSGRVAKGAVEVMHLLRIKEVSPTEFLTKQYSEAVYVNLSNADMFERTLDGGYDRSEFHQNPGIYQSKVLPYLKKSDVLINGIFWSPAAPRLFEITDMQKPDFSVQVIADISCDIDGSVPATVRTTSISEPVFGYQAKTNITTAPFEADTIDIMAVDNLPNELPRDASEQFGTVILETVMRELLDPQSKMIHRATICSGGKLNTPYLYLSDYAGLN
jgi:saccharopine dehydrogenase (NAD+, L-lysine-forming)